MEARFLQTELETLLERRCFLDSDDLRDLRELKSSVVASDVLILIQSRSVLTRPWCLLELAWAIDANVPILGVRMSSSVERAYDFAHAQIFLENLDTALEESNPGALSVLRDNGVDPAELAWKLSCTVPKVISISLDTGASRNVLNATVRDVLNAMSKAAVMPLPERKEWLSGRSERLAGRPDRQHGQTPLPSSLVANEPVTSLAAKALPPLPSRVPVLPDSFEACFAAGTTRIELLNQIKTHLMAVRREPGAAAQNVLVRGMGGVGKTTLSAAAVRDLDVRGKFDIVCWAAIGQAPDTARIGRDLQSQLGATPSIGAGDEAAAVTAALRAATAGQAVLLVLDDCWEADHAASFVSALEEGSGSAALVSSRIRGLIRGAAEVRAFVCVCIQSALPRLCR